MSEVYEFSTRKNNDQLIEENRSLIEFPAPMEAAGHCESYVFYLVGGRYSKICFWFIVQPDLELRHRR